MTRKGVRSNAIWCNTTDMQGELPKEKHATEGEREQGTVGVWEGREAPLGISAGRGAGLVEIYFAALFTGAPVYRNRCMIVQTCTCLYYYINTYKIYCIYSYRHVNVYIYIYVQMW